MRRSTRARAQVFTVNAGELADSQRSEVTISYTYRTLVQTNGHLLHLDIARPTKGLRVQLWYSDCGIRYVNVLDYVGGVRSPRVSRAPESVPTPSVEVATDDWVLPKSGIAFVWVLDAEMTVPSRHQ